jgi:hypothetical protein
MLGIPWLSSYFVLASSNQGLTSLNAAGIASLPSLESVVKAGVIHRFYPGEHGREGAPKLPLLWDRMVSCVCHQTAVRPPSTGRSMPAT